ncbi:MAG: T9SS type A sorting domain-containing protein [Flavobacteriales bacterium]|nr:T9SS type A sorting domain-containing protein [Flavobacteriales bacterium]
MKCLFNSAVAIALVFATVSNIKASQVDYRINQMAAENIASIWPDTVTNAAGISGYAMACFYNDTNIEIANRLINRFHDEFPVPDATGEDFDSYFWLHIVWRIYGDSAMNTKLSETVKINIEEMMWNFINHRSTISNATGSVWRIDDSENHDAMQKGSYLICTEALKNSASYGPDVLLNDGNSIQDHTEAWSEYFKEYFIVRAKEGINVEIASPTYSKYTLGVYHNIMDLAEDSVLREIAKNFMDLYWADVVSDWAMSGFRGGAETRCYKDHYMKVNAQLSSLTWAYGWHENANTARLYEFIVATSSYRPPTILEAIATNTTKPSYMYTSRRFGLDPTATYLVEFDGGNSHIRRDTYVTPDYTMGTLTIDMSKDYIKLLDQNRAMGVYFSSAVNDRVVVHGDGQAQDGRTGYNEINGACVPSCMVVQRDYNFNNSNGTDIFLSQTIWDNHIDTNNWLFSYTDSAYIGIKIAGTFGHIDSITQYGYMRKLVRKTMPIIIQLGQAANYSSYHDFQDDVMDNYYSMDNGVIDYTSNAGDTLTFYLPQNAPKVNGVAVDLNPTMLYDSPYLSMVHGEDTATVSYSGYPDYKIPFTLDGLSGIAKKNRLHGVSIYPNPTNGAVNVHLGNLKNTTVSLLDVQGKLISKEAGINKPSHQLNIKGVPGIYFIRVDSENGSADFKVLKE